MSDLTFIDDLEELSSANDFLDYFEIPYEPSVVQVNRLHIMQRYHDYLSQAADTMPDEEDEEALKAAYKALLERAYQDFVESDALTEKVFRVFKMKGPQSDFVPLTELME